MLSNDWMGFLFAMWVGIGTLTLAVMFIGSAIMWLIGK